MGNYNDCVKKLRQAAGEKWNEVEAKKIFDTLEKNKDELGQSVFAFDPMHEISNSTRDAYEKVANDHIKEQILNTKLNRVRETLTQQKLESALALSDSYKSPTEFIRSFLAGTQKVREGGRGGVDAAIKANAEQVLKSFNQDLEKIDTGSKKSALDMLLEGDLDKRILEKKHVLDGGDNPLPERTGAHDDVADKVAETYHKWNDYLVDRQNAQGAGIAKLQGRGTGQWNNPATMLHGGFEKWSNFIKPLLDEKTFGFADKDTFLKSSYDAITTGTRLSREGDTEAASSHFSSHDLAGPQMTRERVFHFSDPASQLKYLQSEYSHGGMGPAILEDLAHGIKNATLFEQMGTDPNKFFNELVKRLGEKTRKAVSAAPIDSEERTAAQKLSDEFKGVSKSNSYERRVLGNITGAYSQDVNPTVSAWSNAWRTYQNVRTQIASVLRVFPDLIAGPQEMAVRGQPYLQAMTQNFGGLFEGLAKGLSKNELMDEYHQVKAFTEEMHMRLATQKFKQVGGLKGLFDSSTYSLNERVSALANRASAMLYKYNGIHKWDEMLMQSTRAMASRLAGEYSHLPYEELGNERLKNSLGTYGIGKEQWETLRKGAFEVVEGRRAITGDSVFNLPEEHIKSYLESQGKGTSEYQISRARSELGTMINKYIYHAGYQTIMHPDAATRALTNFAGANNGTKTRLLENLVFQLKGFAIQNYRTSVGRLKYGSGSESLWEALRNKNGELPMMATSLVGGAMLYAAGDAAYRLAYGYTPPKMDSYYAAHMLLGGGGLGLPMELLLRDHTYGMSAVGGLAGPTGAMIDTTARLATGYKRAVFNDKKAPNLQTMKFVEDSIPGMRTPLLRPLMNWAVVDRLQNSVSPGSVQKQHQRIEKEEGSKYWLPEVPSSSKK